MNAVNTTINKLISYALDNLLLDALDETYTLNRLATVCGVAEPVKDDVDYGESSLETLLNELKTAVPTVDITAVMNILFPMPRTVNYYFESKLSRSVSKGLDFLFDLFAHGYNNVSTSEAFGKDGYLSYAGTAEIPLQAATLPVGEDLVYIPRVVGNHIATLQNPDILTDDIVSREATFVTKIGGVIATRVGAETDYYCCDKFALTDMPIKKQLSSGAVKISLLDYPVPALAFNGIAKNAVAREVTRVVKAAGTAGISPVVAAAAKDGITFYVVFANDISGNEFIIGSNALTACGVFQTANCAPLLSVLEKGTALSTDLTAFKTIYDKIGGVKLGAKAQDALGGALVDLYLPLLKASASATESQAETLAAIQ